MHVDDSACNLASINLMKFRRPDDGSFDTADFEHTVDTVLLAQEIVVGPSSYPTEDIGSNARRFRQLGLGYANLGAYLMSNGMPYDSEDGRTVAAAITALMTGRGYRKSAEIAAAIGPYEEYAKNREPHNAVMRKHRDAAYDIADGNIGDAELLACRPSLLGRGGRARRRARLPQRAGDGARPDRDDLVPDGLRHDRHRAGLLAGQVQGARRWRLDDDRQPLGPAGAADARLQRGDDRADRRLHQREEHDRRRPGARGRPPAGLRRRRRLTGDLAHGPHPDDVGDAAVPQRGDLARR